jgi:hypothetical protein
MKRRSPRRGFRPTIQNLESKLLLSNVGVSLDYNHENGNPVWVNVGNAFGPWNKYSPTGGAAPTLTENALGYPTSNAASYVNLANYPDGNYLLSYQGTATPTFSGIGSLAGPITTNSSGVSTGVVVVNHTWGDGVTLNMDVTGVSPTATFSNFQLDVPGYGSNPTQVYTNTFLQTLQPFSTVRFLNWDLQGSDTTWATAAPLNEFSSSSGNVPWADIVALGNEAQKNIWINIPTAATTSYVQSLAQLIHSELDPNLKVYFEFSNETWANGSTDFNQTLQQATANPLVTASTNNQELMVEDQTAFNLVTDAKIFDATFGSQKNMVVPVYAGFVNQSSLARTAFDFIQHNFGPAADFVGEYAIAPYQVLSGSQNVAGLTVTQIFADLNQSLQTSYVSNLQSNNAVSLQYGIPLAAYEGGQALVPGANGLNYSVMSQAQTDPRMYTFYVTMMNLWNEYTGPNDLFMAYQLSGAGDNNGFWGMLPSVASPGSEKYDALVSDILAPGDANMTGSVTYADLQTVEAYYGQTGTYWQQGDFNDAGATNFSDLNDVRQNINPTTLTLQQFAQMSLFGQPSVLTAGETIEFDAYGATYLSNLPISSSIGTVKVNQNASGGQLAINYVDYTSGLGVSAKSSVSYALGGAYTEFDSTIGVDGNNSATAVIFQVYGDGKLLYQSSTVTPGNDSIPIAVNVTGVQTLTLDVFGATTNLSADQAVWADARLLSTSNFGTATPYKVQWQLTQNGKVVATSTAGSFEFGSTALANDSLSVTVTNSQGQSATATDAFVVGVNSPWWFYTIATSNRVELDFDQVGNAVAYDVYRSTSHSPSSMVLVANDISIPKYVDTNVTNGTTYYYQVSEISGNGVIGERSAVFSGLPVVLQTVDPYLSSLTETAQSGTLVQNRSAVPDSFGDGATMPISTWSIPSTMGLGTYGNTSYTVSLGGAYKSLSLVAGPDSSAPAGVAMTFIVVGDGKTLYTSPLLTGGAVGATLNVSGVQSLTFETVASGTLTSDYGDWSRVQFTPSSIVSLSSLPGMSSSAAESLNQNLQGGPLVIGGTEFQQGLEFFPYWSVTIPLNNLYKTFTATVGLDNLIGELGSVDFQVTLAGTTGHNYWSGTITAANSGQQISIDVAGATSMVINVNAASSVTKYEDYGDWGLAELHM